MTDAPHRLASPLSAQSATVCIVMPIRNEADGVNEALKAAQSQTFDPTRTEIVVVDGMSTDGTREIVERRSADDPRVRLVDNPKLVIPAAMNRGIESTNADVVVRVDGHCRIASDYVERCVELLAESRAGNVGGLMRPEGTGLIGRAMEQALSSRFGIGDSRFHYLDRREHVDSVYMGAFRREVLEEVGGYDEELLSNEDFELNHRIRGAGYGVLLSPEIISRYTPRDSLPKIWRQFYRYGLWKARVMRKHPDSIHLRHLAAPALVTALSAAVLLAAFTRHLRRLLPIPGYAVACMVAAWAVARPKELAGPLALVFPTMHLAWGAGVLVGLVQDLRQRERPARIGQQRAEV